MFQHSAQLFSENVNEMKCEIDSCTVDISLMQESRFVQIRKYTMALADCFCEGHSFSPTELGYRNPNLSLLFLNKKVY